MDIFKRLEDRTRLNKKTIILPESYDDRVIEAAREVIRKKIANIILIKTGRGLPFADSNYLTIIDNNFSAQFVHQYFTIRKKKFCY